MLAQILSPRLLLHLPTAVFIFAFGACVGSFLNVVVYRIPQGMSVITPPSRCPVCGIRLSFFRDNLPIIGWFVVRGRCRACKVRISPQYMIVELLMALLLLGLYAMLFLPRPSTPWWGQLGGAWWYYNGFYRVWPVFIAFAFMLAGLVAMTLIDARTFTIPLQIPLFVTITAFIAFPLQSLLSVRATPAQTWPIPAVGWTATAIAVGGMIGIVVGVLLLRSGRLRFSFADYHEYVDEDQVIGEYPHARREMGLEVLYLLPCVAGMIVGWLVARLLPAAPPPMFVQAIGATFAGYLVGGGLIWATRILATLAFGREAMGLGDVHLLAAVGAVLGWFDPIPIFFVAPFSGLLWVIVTTALGPLFKGFRRELPYGPHLAVATLVVILCRPWLTSSWNTVMGPRLAWPQAGLVETPAPSVAP